MPASSTWIDLACNNTPAEVAAKAMNCNIGTAIKALEQTKRALQHTTRNQEAAVALLTHSGIEKPVNDWNNIMSRRRWTDVVLGLARAV